MNENKDGDSILQGARECKIVGPGKENPSEFMIRLASRSRGIPLVAWALWRHCPNTSAGQKIEEDAQKAAAMDDGKTVWVKPWLQVHLPRVPADSRQEEFFLLQALLLHGGLPFDLLSRLLPGAVSAIREKLLRFQAEGLVKGEEGVWRVTLLGYPAVRQCLEDEGFLIDRL
jgi:hypothetical protein